MTTKYRARAAVQHELVRDWTAMATQVAEDDDMGLNDWTQAVNKRGRRRSETVELMKVWDTE